MYYMSDVYGNSQVKTTNESTVPNEVEQAKVSGDIVKAEKHHNSSNIIMWFVVFFAIVVLYHFGARV